MLGTPLLRGLVVAGALAFTAVPALAQGGADFWQAKLSKTDGLTIVRYDGKKQTTVTISFGCKDDEGQLNSFSAQLVGKSKGNTINFSGPAVSGAGTASIKATLGKPKATGKVKVDYTEFSKDCKLSKSFKAKYTHATGG